MKKKDTLVIIGNGFDLWQNLKTSYKDFYNYYMQHRFEICKKLKIKEVSVSYDGNTTKITPVELIYGDIENQDLSYYDFWNTFEESLGRLDTYNLNLYYGKEPEDLKDFLQSGKNAQKILKTAFCNWVRSLKIENKEKSNVKFKDNCIFINFNYTSTLENLFGIDEDDVIHIHGEANDKDSIIFGHSIHPHEPEDFLRILGGRFLGLYIVEGLLFETDKQVRSNITQLCFELSLAGIKAEDIKDIYVLGHSLGSADFEYFRYLKSTTSLKNEYKDELKINLKKYNPDNDLQLRINYAIKKYGNDPSIKEKITQKEKSAILKKFLFEQSQVDEEIISENLKAINIALGLKPNKNKKSKLQINFFKNNNRTQDTKWHISCFSQKDIENAKLLMSKIHCNNYELHNSIDETIKPLIH